MFADDVSDAAKATGAAAFSWASLHMDLAPMVSVLGALFTVIVAAEKIIKYAIWIWKKLHKIKDPPDPTES